jgi:hypothetical protein
MGQGADEAKPRSCRLTVIGHWFQAQRSDKIGPDLNRFRSHEIIEAAVFTDLTN